MWNAVSYFEALNGKLKLTKGKYTFCRVTGLNNVEDVLANMTKTKAFLAVDDTDDGATIRRSGGGYFNRRAVVVYLLQKYDIKSQTDRETKVNECRSIYSKLLAKLIKDSTAVDDLQFLDKSRIPYHEFPGMFAAETCGLYFIITLDEPINLVYDATDWDEN